MDGEDNDHPIQDQIHNSDSSTEQKDAPMTSTAPDSEEVSTGAMLESNAQEHEEEKSAQTVQQHISTESPSAYELPVGVTPRVNKSGMEYGLPQNMGSGVQNNFEGQQVWHNNAMSNPASMEVAGTPHTPRVGAGYNPLGLTPMSLPRGDLGGRGHMIHGGMHGGVHNASYGSAPPTPNTPMGFEFGSGGPPGGDDDDIPGYGGDGGGDDGNDDNNDDHDDHENDNDNGINSEQEDGMIIWGTTIHVKTCYNTFRYFIENFRENNDFEAFYLRQIEALHRTNGRVMNLDCSHLHNYAASRTLYKQLIQFPVEVIPILDMVINDVYQETYPDGEDGESQAIQTRTFNLMGEPAKMRALDPENIDQLLTIRGMVIRVSPIIPDLKRAFFKCVVCQHSQEALINLGRIDEPSRCEHCNLAGGMEMVHNRCAYIDKQLIRLQETSDEIPEGETPFTVTLFAFDDLVDSVRPGDRLEVTGVYRAMPQRTNPKLRTVKSIYKTFIDTIHFRRSSMGLRSVVTPEKDKDKPKEKKQRKVRPLAELRRRQERLANGEEVSSDEEEEEEEEETANANAGGTESQDAEDANVMEEVTRDEGGSSTQEYSFSAERVEEFRAFAASGNTYERLVTSFAPSIWEMDDVKRGILCLLFGGTNTMNGDNAVNDDADETEEPERELEAWEVEDDLHRVNPADENESPMASNRKKRNSSAYEDDGKASNRVHQRSDINILLCGDPGTSKSQLLSYVQKITPRGIYTSGKGSSAVGLTASVIRDPETKDMVLESGALVLSDNGICCIDEFDKMSETTRAILHEAMEQQTVSVTKAGIIATLNARTSILASANPKESRYNVNMSVVENIRLPPTLLSRFDLIYLILDKPDKETDRRLARHLVSLYHPDDERAEASADSVSQDFLRDYITYARHYVQPEIGNEAVEILVNGYLGMRALGGRGAKTISATPRQLESLIRISQALAKMRLDLIVSAMDVKEAIRLMRVATQAAATDPRTGTIDMDLITTGRTALDRDLVLRLMEIIRKFLANKTGQRMTFGQIRQALLQDEETNLRQGGNDLSGIGMTVSMGEVEEALRELETDGVVQIIDRTQMVIVR